MKYNYLNIYNNLIKLTRNKKLYLNLEKEDTFSERLIFLFFHLALFLKHFKTSIHAKNLQELFDFIIRQIELSIREIGYGDASINKKMKTYINTFYSILSKIDNWENLADKDKGDLLKSFFNINDEIIHLSKYFDKYRLFLIKSSLNSFIKGVVKPEF